MILVPHFYIIFLLGRRLHVLLTLQVTFKSKGSEKNTAGKSSQILHQLSVQVSRAETTWAQLQPYPG